MTDLNHNLNAEDHRPALFEEGRVEFYTHVLNKPGLGVRSPID